MNGLSEPTRTHPTGVPIHPRPFDQRLLHATASALILLSACGVSGQRSAPIESRRVSADEAAARHVDITALQSRLDRVLQRAVADSAFPGAYAVVGSRSGILARASAGWLDAQDRTAPDDHTLWDLASLTKVIALTSGVLRLSHERRIDLDAPVQRYLPEWSGPNKEKVLVRHLLTHSSGLPAWRPLYKEATSPTHALQLVFVTRLDTVPGARMVYSDLGAVLLGQIVTRLAGMPFDQFVRRNVFEPLGMRETLFRPAASLSPTIAPTEVDPWRQRHLRGEVHDENAFALGGISPHAGLFSSAADLSRFARMYLNNGTFDGTRVLDSATIVRFTTLQNAEQSNRALGWEKPTGSNSAGHLMSPTAFGHTGFTGTSLWIDPANDVFILLLSNRVNPTRENRRIGAVRIAVADAVMGAILGCGENATVLECTGRSR